MLPTLKSLRSGKTYLASSLALGFALASCTPAFQGEYADPNASSEMLDDRWNEDDAKLTASKIIIQMLYENHQAVENNPSTPKVERGWLAVYKKEHGGKPPVVIFKDIENRTDEHIEVKALNEAIRHELINSGKVNFIDVAQRKDIANEQHYQHESGMVSPDTAQRIGRQVGANFFLAGAIAKQAHTQQGKKRVSYQINAILTNIETSFISWSGKVDIKKNFKRADAGW